MFDQSAFLPVFDPCTVVVFKNNVFCLLCLHKSFASLALLQSLLVAFVFDVLCLLLSASAAARRLMLIGL